jgi:hypothetical protein
MQNKEQFNSLNNPAFASMADYRREFIEQIAQSRPYQHVLGVCLQDGTYIGEVLASYEGIAQAKKLLAK